MTASLVVLMVIVVSGVLLGCLFAFARRPASANRGSVAQRDDTSWMAAIMTDGGGASDCSAGDAGCDGGGGGGD